MAKHFKYHDKAKSIKQLREQAERLYDTCSDPQRKERIREIYTRYAENIKATAFYRELVDIATTASKVDRLLYFNTLRRIETMTFTRRQYMRYIGDFKDNATLIAIRKNRKKERNAKYRAEHREELNAKNREYLRKKRAKAKALREQQQKEN